MLSVDLLDIASENNLCGTKVHAPDGEHFSLGNTDDKELSAFGDKARRLNLDTYIETSIPNRASISEAAAIALKTGASSVRFHPRYEGNLRDVLSIIVNDTAYVWKVYQDSGLTFTIERHEDLKSYELVSLVKENEMEPLSLLSDFVNMINVNEHLIDASKTMAPYIIQVHAKDALIVKESDGLSRKVYISGQGDMPFKALLTHLICLGDDESQVAACGLEEEADCYVPAFRLEDEDDDSWTSYHQMSEAPLSENRSLDVRLRKEKEGVINQINHARNVLQQAEQEIDHLLNH